GRGAERRGDDVEVGRGDLRVAGEVELGPVGREERRGPRLRSRGRGGRAHGAEDEAADRQGGEPARGGAPVGGGHGRLLRGDGRAVRAREVGAGAGHRVAARRRTSRIPEPTTTASSAAPANHATLA